jgi:hypothetical protein
MGVRTLRTIIAVIAIAVLGAVAAFLLRSGPKAPSYVFLICLDAVRPDHLGCYGYGRDTSPRIDQLAAEGALFEDAVTQAPWTLPSIATVLSSTFPCQHGARRTGGSRAAYGGVELNFVGELTSHGFETSLFTGGLTLNGKVPAAELAGAALEWLQERLDRKCFIVIHHYDTHGPYVAGRECVDRLDPGYQGRFRYRFGDLEMLKQARVGRLAEVIDLSGEELAHIKALYDCQIMRGDSSIGMIADSLRAWDLLEDAMIIVFADHGEEFLEHGSIDHGQTVYEETIRVPLVVYCPSLITSPRRIGRQVGLIDIGPTILDAVGIEKPSYFEGLSLMPLVSNRFEAPDSPERPCGFPASCLISESIARRSEKKAIRRPPWKLIYDLFFGAGELYNISDDPFEQTNLIDLHPSIASSLTDTLLTMQKYYPGGWCIAWRDLRTQGPIRGTVRLSGELIEVLAHNFLPEIDFETDSLVVADDWRGCSFTAMAGPYWQGVEIRMTDRADVDLTVTLAGRSRMTTAVGYTISSRDFPLALTPGEASVKRGKIHTLLGNPDVECVIYWIDPGTEPPAVRKSQAELRQQLRSIGYIE